MPVAAVGDTAAVSVTLLPTVVDVLDTVSVVVVEVVLEELVEEPEPEPQPAVEMRRNVRNPNSRARCTAQFFFTRDLHRLQNTTICVA